LALIELARLTKEEKSKEQIGESTANQSPQHDSGKKDAENGIKSELQRRRIFLVCFALIISGVGYGIEEESDHLWFQIDDYDILFLIIIGLLTFIAVWRSDSLSELKRANDLATLLVAIAIIFSIYGILTEFHTPSDLVDDLPALLTAPVLLVNGRRKKDKADGRSSEYVKAQLRRLDLRSLPVWVLNTDYDFFKRKLEIARSKMRKGKPAHRRYSNYEANLETRLSFIEAEIERRKEEGSR
jgi:hypothetical protein